MLTFRVGVSGGQAAAKAMAEHLLQRTLPEAQMTLAAYYSGQQEQAAAAIAEGMGSVPLVRNDINPSLGEALGLKGGSLVTAPQIANILSGLSADGEDLPSKDRKVSYTDFTFSVPKSVSVAWMAAETDAERCSIVEACRTANDKLMRYIEREIGVSNFGHAREGQEESGNLAWITVTHYTARPTIAVTRPDPVTGVVDTEIIDVRRPGGLVPGDPQLHFHNIVPNLMCTESGRFVAVHGTRMNDRIHEFGAVGQSFLAAELEAIGISTKLDERTQLLALPCIPEHVCREFSKRTEQAEDAARQIAKDAGHDWDTLDADRKIALLKGRAQAGRQGKGDDLGDVSAWQKQIEHLGWEHSSAVVYGPPAPRLSGEALHESAHGPACAALDPELQKRAVIGKGDFRLAVARGLIAAGGAHEAADVDAVADRLTTGTVMQDGAETRLIVRDVDRGRQKITTALHVRQENEVARLARAAVADTSRALCPERIEAAVQASGLDFSSRHGQRQREIIDQVGAAGALGVFIGAAGAGKTTLLRPLVSAWRAERREVWGAAQAWRQAEALQDAGIDRLRCRALQPLLDGMAEGRTKLTSDSVLVVDELSQVGTRQLLDLLRHREKIGFQLVLTGGERQCQSISAGPVVELLRKALGNEAIPEILTTVRQKSEREQRLAGLFAAGSEAATGQAVGMLREDGHAELVPGGYRAAVARVADLYIERRDANRDDPEYRVTVSAPTNRDSLSIGVAIRERLQAAGEVSREETQIQATDGRGALFGFSVSVGDRVRLYQRTRGLFTDERGRRKSAHIGNNGSVLKVVEVVRDPKAGGLRLETENGKTGFVSWNALRDAGTQRMKLALGYCLTIDSAQGLTSDEHISAMPAGSAAVQAFKAYSQGSRHRVAHWLVGSHGAEKMEVARRRPENIREEISLDECWANVSKNLARAPMRELATDMLRSVRTAAQQVRQTFHRVVRTKQSAQAAGIRPSHLRSNVRAQESLRSAAGEIHASVQDRGPVLAQASAEVLAARNAVRQERVALTAGVVAAGAMNEDVAFEALKTKVIGAGPLTAPPSPRDGLLATYAWMAGAAKTVDPDEALDALLEVGREKHGPAWDWSAAKGIIEPKLWDEIERFGKAERETRSTAETELLNDLRSAVRETIEPPVETVERKHAPSLGL